MVKVLLIGGEKGLLHNDLLPKLKGVGVDVSWHWGWDANHAQRDFPDSCDGVVIIKNMVPHKLSECVWRDVKKRNLPCAWINSKFSLALPSLREAGMVSPDTATTTKPPTKSERLEVALNYIQKARVEDGRTPKWDELQGVIKRVFGHKENLSRKLYRRALNEAAAAQSLVESSGVTEDAEVSEIQDVPEGKTTEHEMEMTEVGATQIYEMGTLVLEEYPELILEPDQFRDRVSHELETELEGTHQGLLKAIQEFKKLRICRSKNSQSKIRKMKQSWLVRHLNEYVQEHHAMPKLEVSRNLSRRIFGSRVNDADLSAARKKVRNHEVFQKAPSAETTATKTPRTMGSTTAYRYYISILPNNKHTQLSESGFRRAIYRGECGATRSPDGLWHVGKSDVIEYIKTYHHLPNFQVDLDPVEVKTTTTTVVEVPVFKPIQTVSKNPPVAEAPVEEVSDTSDLNLADEIIKGIDGAVGRLRRDLETSIATQFQNLLKVVNHKFSMMHQELDEGSRERATAQNIEDRNLADDRAAHIQQGLEDFLNQHMGQVTQTFHNVMEGVQQGQHNLTEAFAQRSVMLEHQQEIITENPSPNMLDASAAGFLNVGELINKGYSITIKKT